MKVPFSSAGFHERVEQILSKEIPSSSAALSEAEATVASQMLEEIHTMLRMLLERVK